MDWITDTVAIGNYREARDGALLRQHGFRSVLSLDGTLTQAHAAELRLAEVAAYRLVDGEGNDRRAFRWAVLDLQRLAGEHAPVLVHCHAGRSRSIAVVAGYLVLERGLKADEALALVAAKREGCVAPALVALVEGLVG